MARRKKITKGLKALESGDIAEAVRCLIYDVTSKFADEDFKGFKPQDLISLLVLYRGLTVVGEDGSSPVDEWLVSVKKKDPNVEPK
jgi:hypothetical protein|tara:strand:- start:6861 stop:7118 length:258 start_codon:yes stop_codon:yes gene_type:complete